jgi:S1-C subfamily serine protease
MRGCVLLLLLLVSCTPAPEIGRVVTIDNPDTGLSLRELPAETLKSIGLPYGLAVVRAGGVGQRAGLKIGDVVYGVNHTKVESLEEFNRLLGQEQNGRLGLLVRRGRADFYVAVDLFAPPPPKASPPSKETLLRT